MSKQLFVFVLSVQSSDGAVKCYIRVSPTNTRPRPHVHHGVRTSTTSKSFYQSDLVEGGIAQPPNRRLLDRISELCNGEGPTEVIYLFSRIPVATVVRPSRQRPPSKDRIVPRSTGEAPLVRIPALPDNVLSFLVN